MADGFKVSSIRTQDETVIVNGVFSITVNNVLYSINVEVSSFAPANRAAVVADIKQRYQSERQKIININRAAAAAALINLEEEITPS